VTVKPPQIDKILGENDPSNRIESIATIPQMIWVTLPGTWTSSNSDLSRRNTPKIDLSLGKNLKPYSWPVSSRHNPHWQKPSGIPKIPVKHPKVARKSIWAGWENSGKLTFVVSDCAGQKTKNLLKLGPNPETHSQNTPKYPFSGQNQLQPYHMYLPGASLRGFFEKTTC